MLSPLLLLHLLSYPIKVKVPAANLRRDQCVGQLLSECVWNLQFLFPLLTYCKCPVHRKVVVPSQHSSLSPDVGGKIARGNCWTI